MTCENHPDRETAAVWSAASPTKDPTTGEYVRPVQLCSRCATNVRAIVGDDRVRDVEP